MSKRLVLAGLVALAVTAFTGCATSAAQRSERGRGAAAAQSETQETTFAATDEIGCQLGQGPRC